MNKTQLLEHLKKRGYPDYIVTAFAAVDREKFVPEHLLAYAYEDMALPLAEGSTISQPSTISFMLELLELEKNSKILEVGAGSGFALALISSIAQNGEIYGLELNKHLAIKAKERLNNFNNVHVINNSGFYGYPEKKPFDRILVSATSEEKPYYLIDQLSEAGILVAPVKDTIIQFKKQGDEVKEQTFYGFSFVPLVKDK